MSTDKNTFVCAVFSRVGQEVNIQSDDFVINLVKAYEEQHPLVIKGLLPARLDYLFLDTIPMLKTDAEIVSRGAINYSVSSHLAGPFGQSKYYELSTELRRAADELAQLIRLADTKHQEGTN